MIAVVGGRGCVGSPLVARLVRDGHDVVVVARAPRADDPPGTRYADLLAPETLRGAVDGADVVVQAVAAPRRGTTAFSARGTEHLVAVARAAGARRVVYLSVVGAGGGGDPLRRACWHAEHAVLDSGLEAVCLRLALVVWPRAPWLRATIAAGRWLPLLPVPNAPEARQQPVWVGDVVEVLAQAVRRRAPQGVFELGGPEVVSLNELVRAVLAAAGLRRGLVPLPLAVARAVALVVERLPGAPRLMAAMAFATRDATARMAALTSAFDVRPTPLAAALARAVGGAAPAAPADPGLSPPATPDGPWE
jgi:NADH dehydrogenase